MSLDIELKGAEELKLKLDDPGIGPALQEYVLEPAASLGVKTAVTGVDGGRNIAVRSIHKEVQPMMARVYTAMPKARAMSIEEGRKSGEWVPSKSIEMWANAVGAAGPYVIKQEIHDQGVKGRRFMAKAKEAIENALPGFLSNMGKAIEGKFNR